MNRQEKLNDTIWCYSYQIGNRPTLIVMHPISWQNLVDEVMKSTSMSINPHSKELFYNGIRVLRSIDIEKDTFIVK